MIKQENKIKCVIVNMLGAESMTAAYLHNLIKNSGFSVKTIHFREYQTRSADPNDMEIWTLANLVKRLNPDLILISVQSLIFWDAVNITKKIKSIIDVKVIWGGPHPTLCPDECIKYTDMICISDGDKAIKELLVLMNKKKSIETIENIWTNRNGNIIKNPLGTLIEDLDTLPFPDFSDKDKIFLYDNKILKNNPIPANKYVYPIMTSRGCAFHCAYCLQSKNFAIYKGKYLRQRSVENVITELKYAKKINPKLKSIYFWDNLLVLNEDWFKKFALSYKKHINIPFFCYGHPATIRKESLKWLKYMGINFMFIGIESGSPKIRKEIYDRHETQEMILRSAKLIKKYKIRIGYDLISSGFDNPKDFRETFRLLLKIPKPFKLNHNNMTFYPNLKITKKALKENIITEEEIAGKSKIIRTQYHTEESLRKNPHFAYFSLLGRRLIPNYIIKHMLKKKYSKRYPKLFSKIPLFAERFDETTHALKIMLQLIISGEFKFISNELGKRIANLVK